MDSVIPELETVRLRLRPFALEDAPLVQQLAGDSRVADTTARIPHPYPDGVADSWISGHEDSALKGESYTWAIANLETDDLMGCISLILNRHLGAEMGYWLGVPYWDQGVMSEAARAVIEVGFSRLNLHRIVARHFVRNPASGRVMQKAEMTLIGTKRDSWLKSGVFESEVWYEILSTDPPRTISQS
jgi:[ribosomal protein S5]-alanine N-acetyltransferase